MGTTPLIKGMESLTLSHRKEPNGTIAMGMVTVTIQLRLSNLMNVHPSLETAQKIDLVVSMPMVMDGLTLATGLLPTRSNGLMPIMMAMVTITCTTSQQTNFTSTSEVMPSLMMPHSGTTPMETVTVTTMRMSHGINIEARNGQVKLSSALRTSTYFHSTEHSGEIRTEIGLATSK